MCLSGKKAFEKTPLNFLSIISAAPSHDFLQKKNAVYPGSPVDQTKWRVFGMIHFSRIPDPTNGQPTGLVDLDGSWV